MTIVAFLPLLVAVLSAVLYLVVARADIKQLAGWSFLAAMIALMLAMSGHVIRLGGAS